MDWPGLAVDGQVLRTITDERTGQVATIDVEFVDVPLLPAEVSDYRVEHAGFGGAPR